MLNIHRARLNPEYVPAVNKQQMGTVTEVPDPGSAFIATFLKRWIDRGEGWKARVFNEVSGNDPDTVLIASALCNRLVEDREQESRCRKVLTRFAIQIKIETATEFNSVAIALWKIESRKWKFQREIIYVTVTCGHGSQVQNHDRDIKTSLPFIIFEHHFGLVLVPNRMLARVAVYKCLLAYLLYGHNSNKCKARSLSITNVEIVDRRPLKTLPDLFCWCSQSAVDPATKKTAQPDSIQQSLGVVPDEVKTTQLDTHLSSARGAVGSVVSFEANPTVTPSNARHWIYSGSHFFLTDSIVPHIQLPKILFNAGILSYLGFTIKLLWKLARMFPGQPHAVTIGFVVPSDTTFIFVQSYSPERVQAPKERNAVLKVAVDATILAGAFICTFIVWWMLSIVGELIAVMFVAFHFGTLYLSLSD
ncbi:hypothetical protein F5051DRAFT_431914 [Lentinula edodes]|nr:hypothetical protein F5051DRAFT_431914 [Lentinula edodes]